MYMLDVSTILKYMLKYSIVQYTTSIHNYMYCFTVRCQ